MEKTENKHKVLFAALSPFEENNLPQPVQKDGREEGSYVTYGSDNLYPLYLLDLYESSSTLKSIIDGNVNYVLGDGVRIGGESVTARDYEILRELVRDYYIFGYGFLQVRRNGFGQVLDVVRMPSEYVRCSKERQAFWYSERWKGYGRSKSVIYPKFLKNSTADSSVYMFGDGRNTYPAPIWHSAVKEVETEKRIALFHLNEIENNFLGSCIINFNNGVPSDEVKDEIEKDITEKFSGSRNAGRILLSFNNSAANRTTIDRLASDNFDQRYHALAQRVREQIFIAFKAQPLLFGLTSETNTGFSTQEFSDLFRLYNKTMIQPVQDMLALMWREIFDIDLEITPFTL